MTQNKTINEQIEELKRGCGKEFYTHDRIILVKCGTECKHDKRKSNQIHLCPTCQARLEGFQKGKLEERERFGRIIHDLEDDIFNMSSLGMLSYMNVITRIKQLQKEIGEEKEK